ncbi:hypothetical protein KPH14_001322 [Odynerus spinipes]|uniref:Uncharacterized protein n=1 Tax=Odynerus spinipes TaxID=1348599 RepID=A0AAD9VKR4_9HYME|nr:hypothetical protein KPH14_001322 [Odynerus spinipes]
MVRALPRQLDDDYAFNVHIKKHQIHKSSAYSGFVKKSAAKAWLRYLVNTPLYREHGVTVDESFLRESSDTDDIRARAAIDNDQDEDEPMIDSIENDPSSVKSLLMAKQHTIHWDEETYLSLAPGMNCPVVAIGYDEHAEELSFPGIYLDESRRFSQRVYDQAANDDSDDDMRQEVSNTVYAMATSEIRCTDRRGVKPEHILYMAMKVMRLRLTDGMRHVFKTTGDRGDWVRL